MKLTKLISLLSIFIFIKLSLVNAQSNKDSGKITSHLSHHTAVGIHGMVLLNTDAGLIASHMPLHHSIHAYQVLLKLTVSEEQQDNIKQLFKESELISLVPETFDLMKLMSGEIKQFKANVVVGHFERGGEKRLSEVQFNIEKTLLSEPIKSYANGGYFQIALNENQTLLVHRIGDLPSFDQIILASSEAKQKLTQYVIVTGLKMPIPTDSLNTAFKIKGVDSLKQLYLETKDFQSR